MRSVLALLRLHCRACARRCLGCLMGVLLSNIPRRAFLLTSVAALTVRSSGPGRRRSPRCWGGTGRERGS